MLFLNSLKSTEAPDEEPTVSKEKFLELKCNISMSTNYMMQGIAEVRAIYDCGFVSIGDC